MKNKIKFEWKEQEVWRNTVYLLNVMRYIDARVYYTTSKPYGWRYKIGNYESSNVFKTVEEAKAKVEGNILNQIRKIQNE